MTRDDNEQSVEVCESSPRESMLSLGADLVEIPLDRRHESGTAASVGGVLLALVVAIVCAVGLGAGYGAFIALCGEKLANMGVAMSFVFWINVPSLVGFWVGHVNDPVWRRRIGWIAFAVCFYSVCVGWIASVLDGPGIVMNPIDMLRCLTDVSVHGVWSTSYKIDFIPLTPYLLSIRFGELAWMLFVGLMSQGSEMPFPYCRRCKRWMDDETKVRVQYDPPTEEARSLAADLVAGRYASLLAHNETVNETAKGLQLSVFTCEGCDTPDVLDATWFRTTPDPRMTETEAMLETRTGTKLVSGLKVPLEIRQHVASLAEGAQLSDRKAA